MTRYSFSFTSNDDRKRYTQRQAEADCLAHATPRALKDAGIAAWLVGSLTGGDFRQRSDINILIDAPPEHRSRALRICLDALRGLPSSTAFQGDPAPHAFAALHAGGVDEPAFASSRGRLSD